MSRSAYVAAIVIALVIGAMSTACVAEKPLVLPVPGPVVALVAATQDSFWSVQLPATVVHTNPRAQQMTTNTIKGYGTNVNGLANDRKGNAWLTDGGLNRIIRVDAGGKQINTYSVATPRSGLAGISATNNAVWFTEKIASTLGMLRNGKIIEYHLAANARPDLIATTSEAVWVREAGTGKILFVFGHVVREYTPPAVPLSLAAADACKCAWVGTRGNLYSVSMAGESTAIPLENDFEATQIGAGGATVAALDVQKQRLAIVSPTRTTYLTISGADDFKFGNLVSRIAVDAQGTVWGVPARSNALVRLYPSANRF